MPAHNRRFLCKSLCSVCSGQDQPWVPKLIDFCPILWSAWLTLGTTLKISQSSSLRLYHSILSLVWPFLKFFSCMLWFRFYFRWHIHSPMALWLGWMLHRSLQQNPDLQGAGLFIFQIATGSKGDALALEVCFKETTFLDERGEKTSWPFLGSTE